MPSLPALVVFVGNSCAIGRCPRHDEGAQGDGDYLESATNDERLALPASSQPGLRTVMVYDATEFVENDSDE